MPFCLPIVLTTSCTHHQGLTYGGLIVDEHATVARTLTLFEELNEFLKSQGFTKVIYKPIPYIYNKVPAEEDLYAIFRTTQFQLVGRDVGTVINLHAPYPWYRIRERGVKRALQNNIYIEESQQFDSFLGNSHPKPPTKNMEFNLFIAFLK